MSDPTRVPARQVNLDSRLDNPGEFYFIYHGDEPDPRSPAGMIHSCPCGCGRYSTLWFRGRGRGRPEWNVTGEWPNVTLSPSIGIFKNSGGGFHWHGFFENGEWVER